MERDGNGPEPDLSAGLTAPVAVEAVPEPAPRWVTTSLEAANQADNLLRQAHVSKMRGEGERSSHLIAEVYQQAPNYAPAVLGYVDELLVRGKAGDAVRILEEAIATSPPSLQLDDKRAELILRTRFRESDYYDPADAKANYASAKIAVMLSVFVPGLGHIALEKYNRGAVIMAGWLLGVGGIFLVPGGAKGFEGLMNPKAHVPFNPLVLLPMAIAVVAFAVGITETSQEAKKSTTIRPDRPVPPVDKPFE